MIPIHHIFSDYAHIFFTIVNIMYVILLFVVLFYIYTKSTMYNRIPELIAFVEKKDISGKEKMQLVVSCIKSLIPKFLKIALNDKVIEHIAQNLYDYMHEYAENYILYLANEEDKKELERIRNEELTNNTISNEDNS